MASKPLVILDRDGVINAESSNYIKSEHEWHALPGSLAAIAQLCRAEYRVVVATNQAGVAKGLYSINTLNRIHQKMLEQLQSNGGALSAIFFCPHDDAANCNCRKPKPGMLLEAAERFNCDLRDVFFVGDSRRDLQAAHAAGAKPALVKTGNGQSCAQAIAAGAADFAAFADVPVHDDLAAFVEQLISAGH